MFWWVGDGPRTVGRVELDGASLSLAATSSGGGTERIGLRELARVSLERGMLHVERHAEPPVHIGSLDKPGTLGELADRLTASIR